MISSIDDIGRSFAAPPEELARSIDAHAAAPPPWRAADLRSTLTAAFRLAEAAGITRIADITGLDSIDLPVVVVTRPNSRSLCVSSGKGLTLLEACASGMIEALELFHAERFSSAMPFREVGDDALIPDLAALPQAPRAGTVRSWTPDLAVALGRELNSGRPAAVPFDLVHADFRPATVNRAAPFLISSNGLAGGNVADEAILHGLLELVERHVVAGLTDDGNADPLAGSPPLDWSTVDDAPAATLHERLRNKGFDVAAHDVTSHLAIPTFYCRLVDRGGPQADLPIAADGSGCHVDPAIALRRALTEAVQTRLVLISGARDDIRARYYMTDAPRRSDTGRATAFRRREVPAAHDIQGTLRFVVGRLAECGFRQVIAVDLGSRIADLSFVRVIVPGLRSEPAAQPSRPASRDQEGSIHP